MKRIEKLRTEMLKEIFYNRTRNPERPSVSRLIGRLFPDFQPFKENSDSLIIGNSSFLKRRLFIIGFDKSGDLYKNSGATNRKGLISADEHSLILDFMDKAKASDTDKAFLFCMIDTYGPDISIESARNLQAFFLSRLIEEFLSIPIRTISLITGEGTSGSALALQVADIRGIMEDAFYMPISPEDLAQMAFKDSSRIDDALMVMGAHPKELKRLRIVDRIVRSPIDVGDISLWVENVRQFLLKAIRDLSRSRIKKLIKNREKRVKNYGVMMKKGRIHEFSSYIKRPLRKAFLRPPPDIRIINYSGLTEVSDQYQNFGSKEGSDKFIECKGYTNGADSIKSGCGEAIKFESFIRNYNTCPKCGLSYIMGASGWIECLADKDSFHELYPELTVDQLLDEDRISPYYREYLKKQKGRSPFSESLVVGLGRINGYQVVMCIGEFYFCSGSMGVVFGEKFRRAVDWAIQENLPLVSVCCSGGLRLHEGILSLMQMAKTVESVLRLKRHGLFYISILANPSAGGTIASYASLGDVIIAEPDAYVTVAGPRVMKSKGFEVKQEYLKSDYIYGMRQRLYDAQDYFHEIRGIRELCGRKEMKYAVSKYLELFSIIKSRRKSSRRK